MLFPWGRFDIERGTVYGQSQDIETVYNNVSVLSESEGGIWFVQNDSGDFISLFKSGKRYDFVSLYPELWTPNEYRQSGYGLFALPIERCAHCKKKMSDGGFSHRNNMTFNSQMSRAGWEIKSHVESDVDRGPICKSCADTGVARFECALCHEAQPYSEVQISIGDSPEYLCKTCYSEIPAKQWDEIYEELNNRHRYDYE